LFLNPVSGKQGDKRGRQNQHHGTAEREEIWAKGISFMRWAAESTATSPVPPMLAMQSPPVMAASMG